VAEKRPTGPTITEWLEDYLEKKGAVADIGPEYYTEFLEFTDRQMRKLIRMIIYGLHKEINRMAFEGRYTDEDIYSLVQKTLSWMAVGEIRFGPDGKLCMFKCKGPKPTPEVHKLLDEKVTNCLPLIRRAFVEIINRQAPLGKGGKKKLGGEKRGRECL